MGDRRRTIQTNQVPPPGVPSSIPRPSHSSLRQSLAPPGQSLTSRQSLAVSARQSLAPYSSQSSQGGYDSQGSSQGQQVFSQGHGGIGGSREPPMTVNRSNHMYSSYSNPMSVSRNQQQPPFGQDYVPPSERRVSTYHRRSTLGGGAAGGGALPSISHNTPSSHLTIPMTPGGGISSSTLTRPSKDPREVRPKRAQERHAEDILQFLSTHQCPFTLSLTNLLGPTSNHFSQVFGFLTKLFDPSINFGSPPLKGQPKIKFEDEVLSTLRLVQYPFTESITKSHLQSIGSMQSWPNMLAMLHWLVMVIESRELAFNSDPELQMPCQDFYHFNHNSNSLNGSADEMIPHAWFNFLTNSYDKFIAGEEEDSWEKDLETFKNFQDQAMEIQRGRVEDLLGEFEELERESKELELVQDPIIAFKRKQSEVERDVERLKLWVQGIEKKNLGYLQNEKLLSQMIQELLKEREEKQSEQERLEKIVKNQKLTPFEITSLNSERQQLTKSLQDVQKRYRSVTEKKMSLEVDLQRQLDSASKLCLEYESKANQLGLLDGPVRVPGFNNDHDGGGGEGIYFSQEINGAAENPVPEGISTIVKPALQKLRSGTKEEINELRQAQVSLEEEMTRLREVIAEFGDVQAGLDVEFEAVDREKIDLNEVSPILFLPQGRFI